MVNEHIMELHNKYGIPIIAGCDSHYISNDQKDDREYLLKSNAISYPEEDGNYMDFPSYDVLVNRFNEQGIFPLDKIYEAINNTNKILNFDDIVLDRTLKVPVAKMFKDKTQEERNQIFINILKDEWKKQRSDINESLLKEYQKEIKHDINEIISCNMADYFIDDYYIVKRGVEKYNGIITPTGRGSSVSMFLNKLLGLTKVDKVNSPVTMYSERFLTASRILDSKTPPDIDNNISSREPFIKAQRDIIGNNTTFDLIAFGTLKYKSAFKMYSRANEVEPSVANEITKQINK
jgi:DNA polymerase III alpha subunit